MEVGCYHVYQTYRVTKWGTPEGVSTVAKTAVGNHKLKLYPRARIERISAAPDWEAVVHLGPDDVQNFLMETT